MNATAFVAAADVRVQSPAGRAEAKARAEAASDAAEQRGAAKERQRILAIITAPEAQYRLRTALHIALKTEMSLEEAREILVLVGLGTA